MHSIRKILLFSLLFLLLGMTLRGEQEEERPFILLPETISIDRQTTWNVSNLFHATLKARLFQLDYRIIKQDSLTAYLNARNLDSRRMIPKSLYKELAETFQVDTILISHLLNCEFREEGGEEIGILEGNLRLIGKDGSLHSLLPFQCKVPIPRDASSPEQVLVREAVQSLLEKTEF